MNILWFRDDLRVHDHPALDAAVRSKQPLVCLYIFEEPVQGGPRAMGAAARWWLHGSLAELDANLKKRGAALTFLRGDAQTIFSALARHCGINAGYWTRRYEAGGIATDTAIKAMLKEHGVAVDSFNGNLLYEPWDVKTAAGTPMKVFTPFWRAARARGEPSAPLPAPKKINGAALPAVAKLKPLTLAQLKLEPAKPDWAQSFHATWTRGETAARARLADFLDERMRGYADNRNRPDIEATSRLSPHLRFGEISPRQIWHATYATVRDSGLSAPASDAEKFLSEVGWREFAYHLLFHFPDLATQNFQSRFDEFPWQANTKALRLWQKGQTGYPIVDAGMRELWQTGWMHNRVRMIVASFLVKHLLLDWRAGEAWFWDTLVDADVANNPASWQWVAGSGADAAPYFRVFNPILQGEKFDTKGDYVRRFVPELAGLPAQCIHKPWEAPAAVLSSAG
ncbi:MAG: cryptochrome/photolyase family protein, partial [Beijerinckiaceae bacterium]